MFFSLSVCFLDKSSSSEARCGMYEGWKLLGFFPHESNNHWSSPQRTHRHHQQVTQSTKRRAQLSTRRTYLFLVTQHTSLACIHGHLRHRHRGNALKKFYTRWKQKKITLAAQKHSIIGHATLPNLRLPKFYYDVTKYPDSYSQHRLLLFSSSRWMGVKFFRSHRQRRQRHFGHCVSGCRSFPVPTAPWCCWKMLRFV